MLEKEEKEEIIKKYKLHEKDTGSVGIQIALLTERIRRLLAHLSVHKKDYHSKRGLLKLVSQRKKLLKYLERENPQKYQEIIKELKIKKK